MNYANEISTLNADWINKIKEIVKWIINSNIYCILSIYHDRNYWELEGNNSKDKYINLWTQIANEFKDFNHHLVFESFFEFGFLCNFNFYEYCYYEELFISQILLI
jgi:aryl-phospho-beta-D-glucosidase BglC (GH1 family)